MTNITGVTEAGTETKTCFAASWAWTLSVHQSTAGSGLSCISGKI